MNTNRTVTEIELEISQLEQQLADVPYHKSQILLSDNEDGYQEALEAGWHKEEIRSKLEQLEIEKGQAFTQECKEEEDSNIIYNDKGQAIEAVFIKSYPHGKLMFAQERLAFVDYDNIIIHAMDLIPFLLEADHIKYQEMKDENDLNAIENQ